METLLPALVQSLVREVVPAVAAIAAAFLSALLPLAVAALRRKWEGQAQSGLIDRLERAAELVVDELNQTVVPGLKRASKDGRLTHAEIAQLRRLARERLLVTLGKSGSREVRKHAGPTLNTMLNTAIEAKVGAGRQIVENADLDR